MRVGIHVLSFNNGTTQTDSHNFNSRLYQMVRIDDIEMKVSPFQRKQSHINKKEQDICRGYISPLLVQLHQMITDNEAICNLLYFFCYLIFYCRQNGSFLVRYKGYTSNGWKISVRSSAFKFIWFWYIWIKVNKSR